MVRELAIASVILRSDAPVKLIEASNPDPMLIAFSDAPVPAMESMSIALNVSSPDAATALNPR